MKLHLAIGDTRQYCELLRDQNSSSLLISYFYFKKFNRFVDFMGGWFPKNLMIDSGAFSVWTKNSSIDIDKYSEYCLGVREIVKELSPQTNLSFVNLDVLPGNFGRYPTKEEREQSAEQGWKNMEYLENKGLKVIHVFHQHEDLKWLDKLAKQQEYIGVSPANDEVQQSKNRWLAQVFSKIKTSVRAHGFAVTALTTLLKFPFYSADSTSWIAGSKYARIPNFKNGKFVSIRYKDKNDLNKLFSLSDNKSMELFNSYKERMREGIKSYQEMEKFITNVWGKRGIIWKI